MTLINSDKQGSQERVPARRIARSYVLSTAKRAPTLIWIVFAIVLVRIEFLQQKRKKKRAGLGFTNWVGSTIKPGFKYKKDTRFFHLHLF